MQHDAWLSQLSVHCQAHTRKPAALFHKNRHQGLSIIKFLILRHQKWRNSHTHIYIYVKNILGCKLSMHFTNNQRMFFPSPASEIYVYIYIYIHVFVLLPPKHRTEFIIFEHRYVVLGPNPANLECVHMIIKYHMCSWALWTYVRFIPHRFSY